MPTSNDIAVYLGFLLAVLVMMIGAVPEKRECKAEQIKILAFFWGLSLLCTLVAGILFLVSCYRTCIGFLIGGTAVILCLCFLAFCILYVSKPARTLCRALYTSFSPPDDYED